MFERHPRISIVIPVFNSENWLGQCLDSLLKQSDRDWEAVCVDDGSTDASARILAEYSALDGRFKTVSRKNGGTLVARKEGVFAATGEWCLFLDPDDWLDPSALAGLAPTLGKTDADIVTYGVSIHPAESRLDQAAKALDSKFNPTPGDSSRDEFFNAVFVTHAVPGHLIGKVVRTQICRRALGRMQDRRILFQEDLCALYRIAAESGSASVVPGRFYNYRIGQGISYRKFLSKEEYFDTFSKFDELNDIRIFCKERFAADSAAAKAIVGLEQRMALASVSSALERLESVEDGREGIRRLREVCSPEAISSACAQWYGLKGAHLADIARTYGLGDILGDVALRQLDYVWRGHNARLRGHDGEIAALRQEISELKDALALFAQRTR